MLDIAATRIYKAINASTFDFTPLKFYVLWQKTFPLSNKCLMDVRNYSVFTNKLFFDMCLIHQANLHKNLIEAFQTRLPTA